MVSSGIKRFSVIGALVVSAMCAAYAGWLFSRSLTPNDDLLDLHSFILTALLATWVVADTKEANRAGPSFDHGWFIFVTFPFYVSYHLISTRRWKRGLLMLSSIAFLFMMPWLAEVIVWLGEVLVWITRWLVWLTKLLISYVR